MANSNLSRFDQASPLALFAPLRALDDLFRDSGVEPFWPSGEPVRVDVRETDQAYEVAADLPGLAKEDIKVTVDGREVSLSAQTEHAEEQRREGVLWRERHGGQWYRSFTLPQEVDEGQAQARYDDGVLRLTLPKKPGAGGTRLAVQ